MNTLNGRVAIVTGAAQGLGFATAERLARSGAKVVMADMNGAKVATAAERIGPAAVAVAVEVTSAVSVAAMVATAADRFGQLDILVNVAGGSGTLPIDRIEDLPEEIWRRVVDVNLTGTFLCCRAAAPHLRRSGAAGRIINFSSGAATGAPGKTTIAAVHAYAASKAGIHGLTSQLAIDLDADGVQVNALQPGFVLTEPGARVNDMFQLLSKDQQTDMLSRIGRPRRPDEVGWAVAWLASAASRPNGAAVRLSGEIVGADNRIVDEGATPLGRVVRLEASKTAE